MDMQTFALYLQIDRGDGEMPDLSDFESKQGKGSSMAKKNKKDGPQVAVG